MNNLIKIKVYEDDYVKVDTDVKNANVLIDGIKEIQLGKEEGSFIYKAENGKITLPSATMEALGLVKGSTGENSISVTPDGVMVINNLNVNKLVQTEGDTLILDGSNTN